jgi:protocatechuate 3,4-dioxygenase beta subunit
MKKSVLLTIAIFVFTSVVTFASDKDKTTKNKASVKSVMTEVSGKVYDIETGEALAGVAIKIEGTDIVTYTDFDGLFSFSNIAPGKYNFVTNLISYNETVLKNVELKEESNILKIELDGVK